MLTKCVEVNNGSWNAEGRTGAGLLTLKRESSSGLWFINRQGRQGEGAPDESDAALAEIGGDLGLTIE